MTFAWPHVFWLLLIPLGMLVLELTRSRRTIATDHTKILRAEAGSHSIRLTGASPTGSLSRSRSRPWLYIGIALAVAAGARPQWGRLEEPVFDQAREILMAIDLSRSMLTQDVKPSRLERAKLLTQSLLEKLEGERVGLLVFSGTAFLQSPLSADYEILREFLPALNPEFLPEGGTNYRALIDTAIAAFGSTAAADRFLIVLSDGEATTNDWRERVEDLKKKGIRVIGLGVGTTAGAMIPDGTGGLVKDERGAVVLSKLESGTLRELAEATNGVYQDASNWIDIAALVSSTVESGKKGQFTDKNTVRLVERFQWPLALALWCLLVSFYYEFPVRPKPREVKLTTDRVGTSNAAKQVTAASLIFLTVLLGLVCNRVEAATETPAAPTPPPLAKIIGRLSAAPQATARDWAELGRETVTWGSKLKSAQQPVPEGPIRDALNAVELGQQLDAKTADWPKLREELEALLKKPDEQKQEQKDKQDEDQQKKDSEQKEDQQKQDQQKQDEQQKKDSQPQQQKESSSSKEPSNPNESENAKQNPKDDQSKDSAFGDMKNHEQPPPPPQPPENSQKVGGAPKNDTEKNPVDPSLALPLQKLDQLRNQDSPAELFKLMEGERDPKPRKKTKDW